jgi:hypothetical protein
VSDLELKYDLVVEAFIYQIECTLATIDDLCMKKSASMSELKRQIRIAQKGIFILASCETSTTKSLRVNVVFSEFNGSVIDYARKVRDYWVPEKPIKD